MEVEVAESGARMLRVSVSLAHYFSDERALCYMAAEAARRVRWLARRVRRTFALPHRVALRCRGHLLPPAEPLALLRPDDLLEVIPANSNVMDLSREGSPDAELRCPAKRHRAELPPSPTDATPLPVESEPERLQEVKRRALALLALHEPRPEKADGDAGHDLPDGTLPDEGRRRRRVRRRRRPPPADPPFVLVEGDHVIRNSCRARAPRLVSALPVDPVPPAAAAAAADDRAPMPDDGR